MSRFRTIIEDLILASHSSEHHDLLIDAAHLLNTYHMFENARKYFVASDDCEILSVYFPSHDMAQEYANEEYPKGGVKILWD